MPASRYVLGCAAVAAFSTAVGLGTVVLVRGAVTGGGVESLSQDQVDAALARTTTSAPEPERSASPTTRGSTRPAHHHDAAALSSPVRSDSGQRDSPQGAATGTPPGVRTAHSSAPASHPRGSDHTSHTASASPPPAPARTTASPTPSTAPSPTGSPITAALSSPGGSVVARCDGPGDSASVYLVSWSPAQGYSVDEVRRGPGQEAEIDFASRSQQVGVSVHCGADGPVAQIETEAGDG